MNLPNKLTLLRVILIPFFLLFMYIDFPFHYAVALVIFAAASITDALDGKIARKRGLVSRGYVHEDFCSSVTLTPEGRKAVDEIFSCFTEVYMFFHKFLGLPHEEAHEQAVTFITTFPQDTCERLQGIVKRTVKKRRSASHSSAAT